MTLLAAGLLHFSLSAGIGSAYDYAGARLELRAGHFAGSAALGKSGLALLDPDHGGNPNRNVDRFPALGLRFFSGEDGTGFAAALNWTSHHYERYYDSANLFDSTAQIDTVTLTAGIRLRAASGFYFEALGGAGIGVLRGHPSTSGHDSTPGPFQRGILGISDLALAVGFEL